VRVASFDQPIYGPERDQFITQAKAVFNCHFYESSRFEQVRVSHCLSLGTPVISERGPATRPPAAFEEAITWLQDDQLEAFFSTQFATPAFFNAARQQLAHFAQHDPIEAYADLVGFAAGFQQGHRRTREAGPWRPQALNLGSGKDYKPGWLNLDVIDRAEPDLVLDLGVPQSWPWLGHSRLGAPLQIDAGQFSVIHANNVLEHVPDLPTLMSNALALLQEGGRFEIEVPYEKSLTAWQDPTHLRALNENSWIYYTGWFWYLGWFTHRFEMIESTWLDLQLQPCAQAQAAFMRVALKKVLTTPQERNHARVMRADFGGVPDDPMPVPVSFATPGAPARASVTALAAEHASV
jgi:SAM-dependent methyltransferase